MNALNHLRIILLSTVVLASSFSEISAQQPLGLCLDYWVVERQIAERDFDKAEKRLYGAIDCAYGVRGQAPQKWQADESFSLLVETNSRQGFLRSARSSLTRTQELYSGRFSPDALHLARMASYFGMVGKYDLMCDRADSAYKVWKNRKSHRTKTSSYIRWM